MLLSSGLCYSTTEAEKARTVLARHSRPGNVAWVRRLLGHVVATAASMPQRTRSPAVAAALLQPGLRASEEA